MAQKLAQAAAPAPEPARIKRAPGFARARKNPLRQYYARWSGKTVEFDNPSRLN